MEPIDPIALWPEGPRLAPELSFPARAYLPGTAPHPRRTSGHMPAVPPCPESWPADWWDCVPYLYGFDLYHFGYFWEAHEVWEEAWQGLAKATPERGLVQGLIFLTATCLKMRDGNVRGARRHCRMARLRLESLDTDTVLLGVAVKDLAMALQRLYRALDRDPGHLEDHLQTAPIIPLHSADEA